MRLHITHAVRIKTGGLKKIKFGHRDVEGKLGIVVENCRFVFLICVPWVPMIIGLGK